MKKQATKEVVTQVTNLSINIEDAVTAAIGSLSKEQQADLLRHYVRQEAVKKQKEVLKNYKDLRKFNPDRFGMLLGDRLIRKLFITESVAELAAV